MKRHQHIPWSKKDLWFAIHMCEHYLNAKIKTNVQYYTRLRHKALKDLLAVQLAEWNYET